MAINLSYAHRTATGANLIAAIAPILVITVADVKSPINVAVSNGVGA